MLLSQHPAIAEQGIDVVNHRETLLGQGSDPRTNPGTAIKDCWNQAGPMATHQWIQYGSFTNGTGTYPLWMDEYTPTSPGSHAAIVSAHGGSWVGGCRSWNDGLSARLAQKGFIVFNIDYLIAYVRQHAGEYASFNGKVAGVGTSAGGNLMYMAGMTGVVGGTRPEVVAGASGHQEMGYMSDRNSACDEAYGPTQTECWNDSQTYLGFPLDNSLDWCGDGGGDNWKVASPACNLPTIPPPTFIANATQELSAYESATDFKLLLEPKNQPIGFCTVSDPSHVHSHGTQLLVPGVPCQEIPGQDPLRAMEPAELRPAPVARHVFTAMVNFIQSNL